MTLARRVKSTVELTELLLLLLVGASIISAIGLMGYSADRAIEIYTEQVACISLSLVMVAIVCTRGALVAREVYEKTGSDASLRAMYVYALYPLIFLAVVIANAAAYFASMLVFGLPLFLLGVVAMFWAAIVLERETKDHFWKTTEALRCYSCGQHFFMDRTEEVATCPRCHLINRNPLLHDPRAPLPAAPSPRGPYAMPLEEGLTWEQLYTSTGMVPLRRWNRSTLVRSGEGVLTVCFLGSLLMGVYFLVSTWLFIDVYTAGAIALVVLGLSGLIGLVMRQRPIGRPIAIASGGLLCLLGLLAIGYEGVGFILALASSVGTYLTAHGLGGAFHRALRGSQPRKVLYPRGKAPTHGTEGAVPPATEGPRTGTARP